MQFNKGESAIVLVEFQKQWTEKGLFHRLIKHQLQARDVVKNSQHLVTKAREYGVTIIHAPLIVDPLHKKGWLAYLTFAQIFSKDTWKAELVPGLFAEGDLIAPRQYYNLKAFDAFYRSDLEQHLKERQIKNIFICGFATDQCPVKTLQTALQREFDPYIVSDCTATFSAFLQRRTERKYSARTMTSQEILASLV